MISTETKQATAPALRDSIPRAVLLLDVRRGLLRIEAGELRRGREAMLLFEKFTDDLLSREPEGLRFKNGAPENVAIHANAHAHRLHGEAGATIAPLCVVDE